MAEELRVRGAPKGAEYGGMDIEKLTEVQIKR